MAQCWLRIGDHLPGPIPPYAGGKTEAKPRGVMLPGHIASLGPPPPKKARYPNSQLSALSTAPDSQGLESGRRRAGSRAGP